MQEYKYFLKGQHFAQELRLFQGELVLIKFHCMCINRDHKCININDGIF